MKHTQEVFKSDLQAVKIPYLLTWVIIYSFGINLSSIQWQSMGHDYSFGINTVLRIDPNSIPYPGSAQG